MNLDNKKPPLRTSQRQVISYELLINSLSIFLLIFNKLPPDFNRIFIFALHSFLLKKLIPASDFTLRLCLCFVFRARFMVQ